jgi:hypothetical protein
VTARHLSWAWVAALLAALRLAQYASLATHINSTIAGDLGDPLLNTWILWWNSLQLPFTGAYWNAPAFAPAPNALALSETLLGLTWLTTPMQWAGAPPLVAYNVMFIVAPVLNGLSAYWLCLEVTDRRDAAFIGALAFAFAPYHASQVSHLQMNAAFFMPIALLGLHRFWNTGGYRWLMLFTAATVMNGFTSGYLLLYFDILLAIAIVWLAVGRPDWRRLTAITLASMLALATLAPVILKYREVQREWDLHRTMTEIELYSADLSSLWHGSPMLALWPIQAAPHEPEGSGYPGLAIMAVVFAMLIITLRDWRLSRPSSAWRVWLVRLLGGVSIALLIAGVGAFLILRTSYKVFGIALDAAILACLLSPRSSALVKSRSLPGLYATGAIAAAVLALGPVGRIFEHRFWYKAPFSWLMRLPGFDSARVPARFAGVEILCLAVLAAFAIARIWPVSSRASWIGTMLIGAAIVIDGWAIVPAVTVPPMLGVPVHADLVVELPTRDVMDDVAAMYRGTAHGRPVMNGYSGFFPQPYVEFQRDLRRDCVKSLEAARGGRSVDVVIWQDRDHAAELDRALRELWPSAPREETATTIVYRQPRAPSSTDPARTTCVERP